MHKNLSVMDIAFYVTAALLGLVVIASAQLGLSPKFMWWAFAAIAVLFVLFVAVKSYLRIRSEKSGPHT